MFFAQRLFLPQSTPVSRPSKNRIDLDKKAQPPMTNVHSISDSVPAEEKRDKNASHLWDNVPGQLIGVNFLEKRALRM